MLKKGEKVSELSEKERQRLAQKAIEEIVREQKRSAVRRTKGYRK